mmetsp:Transcript_4066/g.5589  ORF Transcript_4066/g.5589 Transcript_4066/m.5589 type:complete len:128 (+) Transcript_4066:252-635(+)
MISTSVSPSRLDVGSSHKSMGDSLRMARASATRCFSPPDSLSPRSPTMVSYWSGKRCTMVSCMCARLAASIICSSVACRLPYLILYPMDSLKRTVSWGTTAICLRTDSEVYCVMSLDPNWSVPELGL